MPVIALVRRVAPYLRGVAPTVGEERKEFRKRTSVRRGVRRLVGAPPAADRQAERTPLPACPGVAGAPDPGDAVGEAEPGARARPAGGGRLGGRPDRGLAGVVRRGPGPARCSRSRPGELLVADDNGHPRLAFRAVRAVSATPKTAADTRRHGRARQREPVVLSPQPRGAIASPLIIKMPSAGGHFSNRARRASTV